MEVNDGVVIIPTYNEKENAENIIRAVLGLPKTFHVLIIDDTVTSGKTISDAAEAFKETYTPSSITFLTLLSPLTGC